ncbi:MAG: hypothetical protein ACLQBC_06825 [Syntrophales bacterium]
MQQRYFSVQLSEERKLLKETVKNSEETEKSKIRDEEGKEGHQKKTKSEAENTGKMEMKQETGDTDDANQGGLIDIKV